MAIWSRALRFFGGSGLQVIEGQQLPIPATYSTTPAAAVNFDTAMGVSAFWASARLLSETVASMPMTCKKVTKGVREQDTAYDLWRLLNYRPNRYQTRTEFWETLMLNLVTWGNCYCAIQRSGDRIVGLTPLMSSQMEVELLEDGERVYYYKTSKGVNVYAEQTIWHVKLFGNGIIGLSPLGYARNILGTAIAEDARSSKIAASGGKINGVLTVDKVLGDRQREAVRNNFEGLANGSQDRLFVLEAGMNFHRTALSPLDMQLLESRKFSVEEICRFMGVPSVMVNDTSSTTAWGSGIQQIMEGFYKVNLRPYFERFESSIQRHLQPASDRDSYILEFDFDAITRADIKTRTEAARDAVSNGIMTPNEARQKEGLKPMPGGDKIFLNGAMTPAQDLPLNKGGMANG